MRSSRHSHIVFVEPADSQTGHLRQLLEFEGLTVSSFSRDDLHRHSGPSADLVVLNQMRLRGGTLATAASIGDGPGRPLMMALVAQGDELRGVELVEKGLDAYITSACGSREFVARVRALLRRVKRQAPAAAPVPISAVGTSAGPRAIDIDPARRRVRVRGHNLRLTEQEFQLLYFLAGHPGRVFDRQALLDAVWGSQTFVTARSVDALVKRLRQQLRLATHGESLVETVRGVGYRLTDADFGAAMSAA